MKKFLICQFLPNNDQWECAGECIPLYMTNDWHNNLPTDEYFEVYELQKDNTFICVKEWDE